MHPQLACQVTLYAEQIVLSQNGRYFAFQVKKQSREKLQKLLLMMDGNHNLSELQQRFSPNNPEFVNEIVQNLDKQGFIDDLSRSQLNSGIDTLLELEDLAQQLLEKNDLSKSITNNLSTNILYGFIIEYYHLFSHKYSFYYPLFNFQNSLKIQQLVKIIYSQEEGEDEFLLAALKTINISREQLQETMPLTETMAMCNGLTYWANFDPIFLLSTLGILARETLKNFESYVDCCDRIAIDSEFIKPIKQLISTKLNYDSEKLTRRIFQEIPQIDHDTQQRLRGQTYLFIESYHNFCRAIANHYANTNNLLRLVVNI